MSDAEIFKVRNRLANHVSEPGGMTAGMAGTRAARELAAQQGKSYEAIGEALETLEWLCQDKAAPMDSVYDLSTTVLDIAGLFDDKQLCRAAYSLCELADKLRTRDAVDWAAIKVHVNGMRLIWNTPEAGRDGLNAMVEGLWSLTEHLSIDDGEPEAEAPAA
ncbi:MAG: hypothetical protein KJ901_25820 [Gammaproteobacteria bacterium]|jgi:hypothetical protein|nr:hypothetical protein [Gammaproteobacteria bacterium]MBU2135834.1 hypothetical protein [Alphaproteobacteria bacterium]